MASWTDGAAYAPTERPDGFATPEVAPLTVAERQLAPTPGPIPAPQGFQHTAPQAPLEHIRTEPPPTRNPSEPFRTASATLTAGPDVHPVGERDPKQPFQTFTTGVGSQELPPPSGEPLPPPTGAPIAVAGGFPPPATGQFPPPAPLGYPPSPAASQADPKTLRTLLVIAIAGLAVGVMLPGAAPWLILITGLLGLRTKPLTGQLGVAACSAGVVLLVLSALAQDALGSLSVLVSLGFMFWAAYGLRKNPNPRR